MEHIKDILPSAIQQLTKNKVEYYKRQANHYAKLYIKNGNFASEYKRDYFNNLFTADEAVIIVKLADVYIAYAEKLIDKQEGKRRQQEILQRFAAVYKNNELCEILGNTRNLLRFVIYKNLIKLDISAAIIILSYGRRNINE